MDTSEVITVLDLAKPIALLNEALHCDLEGTLISGVRSEVTQQDFPFWIAQAYFQFF